MRPEASCDGARAGSPQGAFASLRDDPRLRRFWLAVRLRLEAAGGSVEGVRAVVRDPNPDERAAVDLLLGTRSRGRALRVPLEPLDRLLKDRISVSLLDLVTSAVGEVRDRPAERAARQSLDDKIWAAVESHPALELHPALRDWTAELRSSGRWRRLDDPATRLRQALDVMAALPLVAPVGRSRLAVDLLGDAHGLDDDAPAGRLVLSAVGALTGTVATSAAGRRRAWTGVGVRTDASSSTVLTLGLCPLPVGPLTEAAGRWASAGVPLPLTLSAITAESWRVSPGTLVRVCENPAVVDAAGAELGPRCPPLVCTEGRPSTAADVLLGSLSNAGARLAYHGDFGSGGVAIANSIIGAGAEPWRFRTEDHEAALEAAGDAGVDLRPLRGEVPAAIWDVRLGPAIRAAGVEVEEEWVVDLLVRDLRNDRAR